MTGKQEAYQKKWYKANKEKKKKQVRNYRQANKDKIEECSKRYREDNREKLRDASRQYRVINKDKIKKQSICVWVRRKYEGVPCMDCETIYPFCVMDFDHRPEETKEFLISSNGIHRATPERIAKVEKEIAKCDLVCSNCHRLRTHVERPTKDTP